MAIDRAWAREHWSFLVGAAIIVVGNIYVYVLQGGDWRPGGLPFFVAVATVIAIEIGRSLYRRFG